MSRPDRANDRALRWEALDEDILVEDIVRGRFPRLRIGVE
jgi:hypothetical protein